MRLPVGPPRFMKTHLQKRIEDVRAAKLTKRRTKKYIAQIKRQGWSNMDLWGLNTHLARYMLPMLRKFFENPMGYPCNLKSVKEWQDIGAEIIWAMERFANDDFSDLAEKTTGYRVLKIKDDEELRKAWLEETKRLYERADKGLHLFAEYFGNLWD